jgi:hypothetical protein
MEASSLEGEWTTQPDRRTEGAAFCSLSRVPGHYRKRMRSLRPLPAPTTHLLVKYQAPRRLALGIGLGWSGLGLLQLHHPRLPRAQVGSQVETGCNSSADLRLGHGHLVDRVSGSRPIFGFVTVNMQ